MFSQACLIESTKPVKNPLIASMAVLTASFTDSHKKIFCSFDKLIILVWLLVNPELSQFTYSLCTCSTLIPIFSTFYRVTVYTHHSNRYFESFSVHHGRLPTFTMQPLTLTLYFLLALFLK